jgi:energy-coupling factor transport system permease protein
MSEFETLRYVILGQYLPTGSPVHRLDPRVKLAMVVLLLIGTAATDSLLALGGALVAVAGGLALARIPLPFALRGLRSVLLFLLLLAVLQVFTIPQNDVGRVLWQWWRLTVTLVDLHAAALLLLRFAVLYLGLTLFSVSTTTTQLAHGVEHLLRPLQRLGLPAHELSLVVVIALRFVPLLGMEAEQIAKAQASRGADLGSRRGNVFRRALHMLPLLVPLHIAALRRAETLILAMEARGYMGGRGRTHLIQLRAGWGDAVALALAFFLTILLLWAGWMDVDSALWNGLF